MGTNRKLFGTAPCMRFWFSTLLNPLSSFILKVVGLQLIINTQAAFARMLQTLLLLLSVLDSSTQAFSSRCQFSSEDA